MNKSEEVIQKDFNMATKFAGLWMLKTQELQRKIMMLEREILELRAKNNGN